MQLFVCLSIKVTDNKQSKFRSDVIALKRIYLQKYIWSNSDFIEKLDDN